MKVLPCKLAYFMVLVFADRAFIGLHRVEEAGAAYA